MDQSSLWNYGGTSKIHQEYLDTDKSKLFLYLRWGIYFWLKDDIPSLSTHLSIPSWFLEPKKGKTNHFNKIKQRRCVETETTE